MFNGCSIDLVLMSLKIQLFLKQVVNLSCYICFWFRKKNSVNAEGLKKVHLTDMTKIYCSKDWDCKKKVNGYICYSIVTVTCNSKHNLQLYVLGTLWHYYILHSSLGEMTNGPIGKPSAVVFSQSLIMGVFPLVSVQE